MSIDRHDDCQGCREYNELSRRGFLAGAIKQDTKFAPGDFRNLVPRFSQDARAANLKLVGVVSDILGVSGRAILKALIVGFQRV